MIYVILNWNNYAVTRVCISNVLKYEPSSSILLVDNGSNDKVKEQIWEFVSKIGFIKIDQDTELLNSYKEGERTLLLLQLKNNYGYAVGNNYGLKLCKKIGFKYAIIMNNDVFINTNMTNLIKKIFDKDGAIAIIGVDVVQGGKNINPIRRSDNYFFLFWNKIFYPILFPFTQIANYIYRRQLIKKNSVEKIYELGEKEYLSGCFLACNINALNEVHYFDTETFLFFEELLLIKKLKMQGYKCVYTSEVSVNHSHSAIIGKMHWRELNKHCNNSTKYYLKKYKNIGPIEMALMNIAEMIWINIWLPIKVYIKG